MLDYQIHTLPNGLRIVYKQAPNTAASHLGFTINVGARDDGKLPGTAHCFEHMLFKGTKHRKAMQIINRLEVVGGEMNAFTTKEITVLYASIINEYTERALELLVDLTFNSIFPDKELLKEKKVITEEINMYLDTPEENIYDEFQEMVFKGHALAPNILGTTESLNEINADNHRIWVTGLIHKEAYFLIPDLQEVFDNISASPVYNGNPLVLDNIYLTMADAIVDDADLKNNLPRIANRINYLSSLDCSNTDKFRDSWKAEFDNTQNDIEKNELILALLTIKKAKDYWHQIHPPSDYSSSAERFREQLLLEIGQFYSYKGNNPRYHISFFLAALHKFV